ncbi:MAG: ABC transporter ATP-binding protein [Candidatus Methylarchaceae archaeon HK02M1]|nr:ABC transporter ATP-binding protein [Candidatus Methylarchaceae archaeon HK02M1]
MVKRVKLAAMSSVETNGLTRRFGSFMAVDHLSFEVKEGEVFGLLGPNGAGKTTTVRMLACLISSSEGSASVGGYDIGRDSLKVRQIVGILTENPSLYERLTAYENMDFFAEAYGLSDVQEKRNRIRELLEFFELYERRNNKVATFSKGMKQKLAIARALVHQPPILFLDEPTAGLDPESSKVIRDLIERLSQREKHTILLCTHHLEDAEKLCNRVMIINRGKSVIVGSPDELRDKIAGQPVLQVILKNLNQKIIEAIKDVKQVKEVDVDNSASRLIITLDDVKSVTPEVVRSIVYAGGMVLSVNTLRPSLEEAYLKLVKEEWG